MACPCTHRASNIDAFPSAIVLPKQKPEDHSPTSPSLPHTSQPVIDTLTRGMNTSTKAEKRHLDSIACLGPLNSGASWNVLSPCCPGRAIFIPVQPLCSSTCHLHSELPAVDLLTASEPEGIHSNIAHVLYLAVVMLLCWWSAHCSGTVKTDLWANLFLLFKLQEHNFIN